MNKTYPEAVNAKGSIIYLKDGRLIFDAASGAAVTCLGYKDERVILAVHKQMSTGLSYLASSFWVSNVVENLSKQLIKGTDYKMARVYLACSGSEATEAAIKLCRQFFYEKNKNSPRFKVIARQGSYHGNSLGALSVSGFPSRRAPYEKFLMNNVYLISACNAYRQKKEGESNEDFVGRKAAELDNKFKELGPETVMCFIMEPVVGAALGCVPYVPGYLEAMRNVCHKHGALIIFDEVMCGMGRTGFLHAWQAEGVVPDIQTIGKGLGGGYQAIAAVLISENIVEGIRKGSGEFVHGQTYQAMPVQAAAALEVLRIIRVDKLLENVNNLGKYLEERLKAVLGSHPNVGNIRGMGFLWGLEFVKNKTTKEPFDPVLNVATKIHDMAISSPFNMTVYPGIGSFDGKRGDHIIIAPTYILTKDEVDHIVKVVSTVVIIVLKRASYQDKFWIIWRIKLINCFIKLYKKIRNIFSNSFR